jgi:S1-C subfamily serine protease
VQSLLRALGPDSIGQTVALGVRRTGKTQQVSLKIT